MVSSSQVGSALAPDGADEARSRELRKLKADLGLVLLGTLSDPKTVEVLLNADGRLWQERLGELMRKIGAMEARQAEAIVRAVAAILKRVVTRENPIIGGELPDGSRFAGQLPPMVSAPCFAIRKRASGVYTLGPYADAGIMTPGKVAVVRQAVRPARFSRLSFTSNGHQAAGACVSFSRSPASDRAVMVYNPQRALALGASLFLSGAFMTASVYQRLVNDHEIEPLGFFFAALQAVAGVLAICFLLHASLVR